jgi:uncharacterized protein DUF4232
VPALDRPPVSPEQHELEALIREARARQRRRRLAAAAVVAVAAAGALAIHGVLAGRSSIAFRSRSDQRASLASPARCRSAQLRLSAPKTWNAAAGSLIEQFTLTNVSRTSCTVAGWPAVRRLDHAGRAIPVNLERWVYRERGRAPFGVVRLRPRGLATFPVVGSDWDHAADRPCPSASTVRAELPASSAWLAVPLKIPACRRWLVGPLVPGRLAQWPTFALSRFYTVPTSRRPFYSGLMNGVRWKLRVHDGGDGRYCFEVFTDGDLRATKCGRLGVPGLAGKLAWISRSRGPSFVAGAAVARATQVGVHLSGGHSRHLQTMPPTRALAPGISFFFTTMPPGSHLVGIAAHNALGRVVAGWPHAG